MTTTTSPSGQAGVGLPEDRDAAVPTTRLVGVEMRKMLDTRAGFWLIVTIVVLTVAAVGLFAAFAEEGSRTFENYLGTSATPQGLLLPVLGVLLVTSEWGQRAALTTFTLVPHRSRVIVAKVLAALVIGLGVMVVAVLVAALVAVVRGAPDAFGDSSVLDATWRFALLQAIGILQGLAFGLLFLNSAAAIVTYFLVPVISSLVFNLVPQLQDAAPWVDLGTAQGVLTTNEAISADDWAHLVTASLVWIALPMVVGVLRVLRSEVK